MGVGPWDKQGPDEGHVADKVVWWLVAVTTVVFWVTLFVWIL
jgi:hypothetical protein